jgi:signal transduction histidine kinase
MRSLRIRFILAFIGVVFFVGIVPSVVFFNVGGEPDLSTILENVPEEAVNQLRDEMGRFFVQRSIQFTVTAVVVGIIAGILLARNLTAPLNNLADTAKAIGARDLSQRVVLKGNESDEIAQLAAAFNNMAHDLENAESLRQNLLADVAHELRTPITVIQGNLRAMLDGVYPLNEEEIARLYDQTRHLTQLVNDLRELAQAEANRLPLNITKVDLVSVVKDAGGAFRPIAEAEKLALRVELLGKLPYIQGDQARLTQSLHNLLNNALNHTPAGGTVTMQVEHVADEIQIRVRDTGAGISAEHLPHVFDRFYRTDKARTRDTGGTGLGLAIVNAIVLAHNGTIEVRSAGLGQGSTFTIHLPV